MKPVWIVDDDRSIRWVIEKALSRVRTLTGQFDDLAALARFHPVKGDVHQRTS